MMKNMYKSLTCAAALAAALPAAALQIQQDFAFSADIIMNDTYFKVVPTAGAWPDPDQLNFKWNDESKEFDNLPIVSLWVKSVADVTVRRTTDMGMVHKDHNAEIPVLLHMSTSGDNEGGLPVGVITTDPSDMYDYSIAQGEKVTYQLLMRAEHDQMTDNNGDPVIVPMPGRYDGVIGLIFESTI